MSRYKPKSVLAVPCLGCGTELLRKPGMIRNQRCRPCYEKKWRDDHRERIKAQRKARREADPEKYRAKDRRDYHRDIERSRARQKRSRDKDPERARERERRHYLKRRERKIAYALQWQKDHPGRHAANERARRAKLAGLFVEYVHPLAVLEMSDGVCGICGEDVDPGNYQVDHIYPVDLGGEHSYANTQPAHPLCNMRKGNRVAA